MVKGQNFINNQSVTTFYFNSGNNTRLFKNKISRTNFNRRTSINSTRIKMNAKISYRQMLKFSCKFKHYLKAKDYYSKY